MMRMILFSLLTFSLLFSNDSEGYVFELNLDNDFYVDMESVIDFSVGTYEFQQLFSARMLQEFEKPNPSSGEIKMIQSFQNVIASSRRNDEMKPNHDAQKLSGTSYTMIIDSLGFVVSTIGNSDLAQEVLEESDEVNWLFGVNSERGNLKYFMGSDSLQYVGDVWSVYDTTYEVTSTYGFEKFNGSAITYSNYSFEKIKKKRGNVLAVVKCKAGMEVQGIGTNWDQTIEFTQIGEFICTITFNVTRGLLASNRVNGTLIMKGVDLGDDSSWRADMNIALKQKGKLK